MAGRGTDHCRSQSGRPARGGIPSRTGGTSDPGGRGRHARLRLARPDQRRAEGQAGQCRLAHAPQGRGRGRARARRGADHPDRGGGASGAEGQMAIDAPVSAQPIILGAQTLPDASATLKAAPGAPLNLSFNLGLPGQSRLRGDGDLETGAAGEVSRRRCFRERRLRASARLGESRRAAGRGQSRGVWRRAPLSQRIAVGRGRSVGDRILRTQSQADAGSHHADRRARLHRPGGGQPGRLDLDLASDSLDVDALPSLAAAKTIGDLDLSLSLRAGSLHIARVGETEIDSGSLAVNLTKTGPNVALKRLSVAGLDGASLEIEGATVATSTAATGHLRADRLHDFAALVSRLAPGDWSRMLVERAGELSPAALTFERSWRGGRR